MASSDEGRAARALASGAGHRVGLVRLARPHAVRARWKREAGRAVGRAIGWATRGSRPVRKREEKKDWARTGVGPE